MAISAAHITDGSLDTGASPQSTASIAFANNKLYVLSVTGRGLTAGTFSPGTSGGLTWTNRGKSSGRELWTGFATSGATTAAISMSWTGTMTSLAWSVEEFTGVDTTTPVVQAATPATGTSTTSSVTLAAFGDATNNVVCGFTSMNANQTATVDASPAGYAALLNLGYAVTPVIGHLVQWNTGQDTTVTATFTSAVWFAFAIEIKMAAAGVSTVSMTLGLNIGF